MVENVYSGINFDYKIIDILEAACAQTLSCIVFEYIKLPLHVHKQRVCRFLFINNVFVNECFTTRSIGITSNCITRFFAWASFPGEVGGCQQF